MFELYSVIYPILLSLSPFNLYYSPQSCAQAYIHYLHPYVCLPFTSEDITSGSNTFSFSFLACLDLHFSNIYPGFSSWSHTLPTYSDSSNFMRGSSESLVIFRCLLLWIFPHIIHPYPCPHYIFSSRKT